MTECDDEHQNLDWRRPSMPVIYENWQTKPVTPGTVVHDNQGKGVARLHGKQGGEGVYVKI